MEQQCKAYLNNSLAPSTRRTYSSVQQKFAQFCNIIGRSSPLPADERTLCLFTAHLAKSIQSRSIKVYLSAIRSLHIENGFADPIAGCQQLQLLIRGIKRMQGHTTGQRLPITNQLLMVIRGALDFRQHDHVMFWAACTLAYFGFLRAAEFTVQNLKSFDKTTHLQVEDLAFDDRAKPSCMELFIKASKTDPFRKGCKIYIGRGSQSLCAVSAMSSYLHIRGGRPGPLFLLQSGQPLSRERLTSWLRIIFTNANIGGNYSSHSFRIGAATVAANNNVPPHLIQALGRWSSNAYLLYTRSDPSKITKLARIIS